MDRPLISESTAQLAKQVEAVWEDANQLRLLRQELSFRKKPKAQALLRRIDERLIELRGSSKQAHDARKESSAQGAQRDTETLKADLLKARQDTVRLERLVIAKQELEASLRDQLARAEARLRNRDTPNAALYARLGLLESFPAFAIKPLRTAFRKEFHPDHKPVSEKAAAEAKFKEYEQIFDHIAKLKGRL